MNVEVILNGHLGEVLRGKHPLWREGVGVEQSRVFRDRSRRPDILVRRPGAQPVVLETEFHPGREVEDDARARLGQPLTDSEVVEQSIAVLLPEELRTIQHGVAERLATTEFRYAVFSGTQETPIRWPRAGWLVGDIDDLAACIEHASMSERRVAEGTEILERGVRATARMMHDYYRVEKTNTLDRIAQVLHQEVGEQTTRMAMAIVTNAMTFHAAIAGTHDIPDLPDLRHIYLTDVVDKGKLLRCWAHILAEINYWPIFSIASDLVAAMPQRWTNNLLKVLEPVATKLAEIGGVSAHDLSGQMFQRLIVDRKFLATFYTLPSSATLLAELATTRLNVDWSDTESLAGLRIADLACGTGTLLSAAYQAVQRRYRREGGDDALLHPAMMEKVLVAADIMPAATHLTASALSGAHPSVPFSNTRIVTMPYGEQPSETGHPLSLGSLDLLEDERARSLMGTGSPGGQIDAFGTGRKQVRGTGEATEAPDQHFVDLPHESGDLLIMNPPFTRPTNHESTTIPVPSFAGFDTSRDEQRAMSGKLVRLRKRLESPGGTGNAGLASYFVDLAHVKTKPGGVVALVLPASFVRGESWAGVRELLERFYEDVVVVSVAASGNTDRAFSADTGMAEVLVVATKRRDQDQSETAGDTLFVNLTRRPRSLAEGAAVAVAVRRLPTGDRSGRITLGNDYAGSFVRAPLARGGCAGLREPILAEAMLALSTCELQLPRTVRRAPLPVVRLGQLGKRGKLHRDIAGKHPDGTPRGPFDVHSALERPVYPILWSHDADQERTLIVAPRQQGVVREGFRDQAGHLWETTASRLHFTLDFQLNSQSLAACLTLQKSIGGRAWPNFVADRLEWEKPLALWANSTLGVICFWWVGMRQQQGRAMLTISRLPRLLVLDPRALSDDQIAGAEQVFDQFEDAEMLPANEAYRDPVRHELDRALLVDVLGLSDALLEPLAGLRDVWCAEPSVHGGKSTRPE